MRRYSDKQALTTLSEINVTPLLDLAFVLLIIFMITTPLLERSMDLIVPTSEAAEGAVDPAKVLTVSIDRDDVLQLEKETVTMAQLEESLRAMREADPQTAVVVRPHRDLPVQKFISVMDAISKAGITKVGVMTRPPGS
ncbi:MAG: biopolymer transporter ExbD [Chthoniobacterales bacterium]|nr:biopolymer transporter ExbD [Chthoniobacterales bacterium]